MHVASPTSKLVPRSAANREARVGAIGTSIDSNFSGDTQGVTRCGFEIFENFWLARCSVFWLAKITLQIAASHSYCCFLVVYVYSLRHICPCQNIYVWIRTYMWSHIYAHVRTHMCKLEHRNLNSYMWSHICPCLDICRFEIAYVQFSRVYVQSSIAYALMRAYTCPVYVLYFERICSNSTRMFNLVSHIL